MITNVGKLAVWPHSRKLPHMPVPLTHVYTSPPMVDYWLRPLPPNAVKKLFSEAFWKTAAAKYGPQALRLEGDVPKISLVPEFRRKADLTRLFGKQSGTWMWADRDKLNNTGYALIVDYLDMLVQKRIGAVWSRKRWHYERKRWPFMDEELLNITALISEASADFARAFQLLTAPSSRKAEIVAARDKTWHRKGLPGNDVDRPRPTLEGLEREGICPLLCLFIISFFLSVPSWPSNEVAAIPADVVEDTATMA